MRTVCVALLTLGAMTALVTGCGGGSSSADTGAFTDTTPGAVPDRTTLTGSTPIAKKLAITFPVPKPQATDPPGTAAEIKAGRKACKGKKPIEVREEFIDRVGSLTEDQEKVIGELPKYEKGATSPNFPGAQIAADVYQAGLPEKKQAAGFRGCVYELALQRRRELAKGGSGGK